VVTSPGSGSAGTIDLVASVEDAWRMTLAFAAEIRGSSFVAMEEYWR
jgi:hypothetical protein